ncbi:Myb-like DNA-binding domain containing protein [Histomonas meleagridis]|uniref:Myb-like DNA-binding domain containing protein n=1 Tax=Histomonas meleagridis TaxID=135588 RepID=UPI00355A1BC6|nr:Myb-like DNA-binding domain containing protein [Histomonas meleagridis]KAH0796733.1 Myb-like DNA-binding domain containing protein [Histomonas meleagridis]
MKNTKGRKRWSQEEDQRLKEGVHLFGSNFEEISNYVGNDRNHKQCYDHWHKSLNPDINKGEWTKEEKVELCRLYKIYKGQQSMWAKIAKDLSTNRTPQDVRNMATRLKLDLPHKVNYPVPYIKHTEAQSLPDDIEENPFGGDEIPNNEPFNSF